MQLTRAHGAGFTLVELLVAMGLGLAAMAGFLAFQRFQMLALEDQAKQLDLQTATRSIVDLFAREVRRAGMDPACTKAFDALLDATASQARFQADLNANGVLDAASEDLTYRLVDGARLERVAGADTDVLLDGVSLSGSRLRYFDATGAELVPAPALDAAQRATVRRVRLELAVADAAANPQRRQPLIARAATDVELRNRFFVASIGCS
jgi:type II secretory pathway component PulJ